MIIYTTTTGTQTTNSSTYTAMPGLSIKLPEGVGTSTLLILNVPNPYATGTNFPGGNFGIEINGALQAPVASFTYNEQNPASTGRIPTTLCVVVPLISSGPQTAVAVWSGVRGSTVHIDSPATLTATVG